MHATNDVSGRFPAPLHGAANPSTHAQGTTPGSFARRADIGGPLAFSSPDTPGMPAPSDRTAWDFLPQGWSTVVLAGRPDGPACANCCGDAFGVVEFESARGEWRRVIHPRGFVPVTRTSPDRARFPGLQPANPALLQPAQRAQAGAVGVPIDSHRVGKQRARTGNGLTPIQIAKS